MKDATRVYDVVKQRYDVNEETPIDWQLALQSMTSRDSKQIVNL